MSSERSWKIIARHAVVLLFSIHALSAVCATGFWPQWRGPNRDGVSTESDLLVSWPTKGPPLVWCCTNVGAGYSSVAVADGKVFTMGDGADESYVYALDDVDGKLRWKARVGKPGGGNGYPGTRSTPTIDGGLVFALGQFGDLVCVDTGSGKEHWRRNLLSDFRGKMMSDWSYAESPLADGDRVVVTPGGPDGTVVALNKNTGSVVWRTRDFKDNCAYCSMIVAQVAGQRQYIQLTDAHVIGIAASDGSVLWQASRPGQTAVIPTPVFYGNCVYVTSGYGAGCSLFRVSSTAGQFKAEQVYANKAMANHHGGVVRVGEYLYGYSEGKGWVCQEFETGRVMWEQPNFGKGSIVAADNHLYLRGEDRGSIVLLEASPQTYRATGFFEQPFRSKQQAWAHPVVAGGKLYLRDQDVLLCYNVHM